MADDSLTITLSPDDRVLFMLVLGYATNTACKDGDFPLAYRILALANRLNRDNPEWVPYNIPDEFKSEVNQ
jgi:hypothetical protein